MKTLLASGWPGVLTLTGPRLEDYAQLLPMDQPLRLDLPPLACTPPRVSRAGQTLPAHTIVEMLQGQSHQAVIENAVRLVTVVQGSVKFSPPGSRTPPKVLDLIKEVGSGAAVLFGKFLFRAEGSNPAADGYWVKLFLLQRTTDDPEVYLFDGDGRQFAEGKVNLRKNGILELTQDPTYPSRQV